MQKTPIVPLFILVGVVVFFAGPKPGQAGTKKELACPGNSKLQITNYKQIPNPKFQITKQKKVEKNNCRKTFYIKLFTALSKNILSENGKTLRLGNLGAQGTDPGEPPNVQRVLNEHKKLIEKYDLKETKRIEPDTGKMWQPMEAEEMENREHYDFGTWLKNLSLPLIVIITVILAVLFYFLFRGAGGLFPGTGRLPLDEMPETGEGDAHAADDAAGDGAYSIALELARGGELGKALVLLHKSSLRKLQQRLLVPPGDFYTNNQVKRILKVNPEGSSMVNPFGQLAAAAERCAFKGEEPEEPVFLAMKTLYENTFLKMGNHSTAAARRIRRKK